MGVAMIRIWGVWLYYDANGGVPLGTPLLLECHDGIFAWAAGGLVGECPHLVGAKAAAEAALGENEDGFVSIGNVVAPIRWFAGRGEPVPFTSPVPKAIRKD